MIFRHAVAMMTAAMAALGLPSAKAEDIALSLVHPKGRVDVPVSAVRRVDALATFTVHNTDTGEIHEYPDPHVVVCFTKEIGERICQLTREIVGEPLAIVVNCETVVTPIVRQPLCTRPCLDISNDDLASAITWAQKIRNGTNRLCAPSS